MSFASFVVKNPLLVFALSAFFAVQSKSSRRHPRKNIRWRYPDRFPYRVIYEVDETRQTVIVAAVLHAARHDEHWQSRVGV